MNSAGHDRPHSRAAGRRGTTEGERGDAGHAADQVQLVGVERLEVAEGWATPLPMVAMTAATATNRIGSDQPGRQGAHGSGPSRRRSGCCRCTSSGTVEHGRHERRGRPAAAGPTGYRAWATGPPTGTRGRSRGSCPAARSSRRTRGRRRALRASGSGQLGEQHQEAERHQPGGTEQRAVTSRFDVCFLPLVLAGGPSGAFRVGERPERVAGVSGYRRWTQVTTLVTDATRGRLRGTHAGRTCPDTTVPPRRAAPSDRSESSRVVYRGSAGGEPLLERLELLLQRRGHVVAERPVVLLELRQLPAPGLGIDRQQLGQDARVDVEALGVDGVGPRTRPMGVSTASPPPSTRSTTHLSTRLFSPKPGQQMVVPCRILLRCICSGVVLAALMEQRHQCLWATSCRRPPTSELNRRRIGC